MKAGIAVAGVWFWIFSPAYAWASTGGPLTVEVLGWDPATEHVYARQVGHDQSGERDCVFYFDLRDERPTRPQVVPASRPRWGRDSTEKARIRSDSARLDHFLSRLRPLLRSDEGEESIVRGMIPVDDRSEVLPMDRRQPMRRVIVSLPMSDGSPGDSILVTTYFESRVNVLRRYRIPGRTGSLIVLSFMGDPYEGGYEVQRCALLGFPGSGVQRLDSRNGILPWPMSP